MTTRIKWIEAHAGANRGDLRAQAQVAVNQQALNLGGSGLVEQQELIVKTAITRGGLGESRDPRRADYPHRHDHGSRYRIRSTGRGT